MPLPAAGAAPPTFVLTAAVSGREVSVASLKGKRAVLVLHGVKTSDVPKEVGKAVRAKHPRADVVVANVVNLKSMGGLWKRVAEAQIKSTYEKLAGRLKETGTPNPEEFVLICPDWDNAIAPSFGVMDSDLTPGVVVLGKDGKVLGVAEGPGSELAAQAVALLG
jgi:hypothetical protein